MEIKKNINSKWYFWLSVLGVIVISMFVVLPLFHAGWFPMHDDTQIGRIGQMTKAIHDGEFPVRWVKDLGFGYGYPIFNFYAPLPFYIGSIFNLVGFSVLNATKLTFGLALLLSAVTMYLFAREFFNPTAAVVSSIVYVYFPYHAVDTYVRGNLDELCAYAFLPLVFLSFYKLYLYAKSVQLSFPIRWVLVMAISVSLVTLSHNLSAFMLLIILAPLFILSVFFVPRKLRYVSWFLVAAGISIALSAFYILPAVAEMHMTNVLTQVGGGSYYADHFVCPSQLWNSPWGFGGSVKGCMDGMSFKLGKDNILFAILAMLVFVVGWLKRDYSEFFFKATLVLMFVVSLWLVLPWSLFLWRAVPFMAFLQFPWRFLIFVGFFLSVLVGMGLYSAQQLFNIPRIFITILAAFIVGATIFYNAHLFSPQSYAVHPDSYYSSSNYLKWYVSKQSSEYLPKNFQEVTSAAEIVTQPVVVTSGNAQLQTIHHTTIRLDAHMKVLLPSTIHINLAYFPNWTYTVDDHQVPIHVQNNGISLILPSGEHTITARYSQTLIEKIANGVTLLSILVVLLLIIRLQYKRSI